MVFQEKLLSHYVGQNHTVWLRNFPKCCSNSAIWNLFWGEYCFSYKEKVTVKWKFTCKVMFPLETVTFYCNFTTYYIILYVIFFVLLSVVLNWKIYSHSSEKYLSFKELNPQPPRNVEVFLWKFNCSSYYFSNKPTCISLCHKVFKKCLLIKDTKTFLWINLQATKIPPTSDKK